MKPPHPIWDITRSFVVLGWATFMLWICATEFDATEWKAIGGISLGVFGTEAWRRIQEYRTEDTGSKPDAEE